MPEPTTPTTAPRTMITGTLAGPGIASSTDRDWNTALAHDATPHADTPLEVERRGPVIEAPVERRGPVIALLTSSAEDDRNDVLVDAIGRLGVNVLILPTDVDDYRAAIPRGVPLDEVVGTAAALGGEHYEAVLARILPAALTTRSVGVTTADHYLARLVLERSVGKADPWPQQAQERARLAAVFDAGMAEAQVIDGAAAGHAILSDDAEVFSDPSPEQLVATYQRWGPTARRAFMAIARQHQATAIECDGAAHTQAIDSLSRALDQAEQDLEETLQRALTLDLDLIAARRQVRDLEREVARQRIRGDRVVAGVSMLADAREAVAHAVV